MYLNHSSFYRKSSSFHFTRLPSHKPTSLCLLCLAFRPVDSIDLIFGAAEFVQILFSVECTAYSESNLILKSQWILLRHNNGRKFHKNDVQISIENTDTNAPTIIRKMVPGPNIVPTINIPCIGNWCSFTMKRHYFNDVNGMFFPSIRKLHIEFDKKFSHHRNDMRVMDNGMSQTSCTFVKSGHMISPVACPNNDNIFRIFIKNRFLGLLENRMCTAINKNVDLARTPAQSITTNTKINVNNFNICLNDSNRFVSTAEPPRCFFIRRRIIVVGMHNNRHLSQILFLKIRVNKFFYKKKTFERSDRMKNNTEINFDSKAVNKNLMKFDFYYLDEEELNFFYIQRKRRSFVWYGSGITYIYNKISSITATMQKSGRFTFQHSSVIQSFKMRAYYSSYRNGGISMDLSSLNEKREIRYILQFDLHKFNVTYAHHSYTPCGAI
ncbi:hypothetical protein Bhyg_13568 [Pseudolycoriella hygida]|uniref:Uncharacterized protein n=1 Tax=Pseudolycoriella hygida TaxID=35572 RepID=A0A9Q0MNI4_9DIPT|nr:hypothetical protein Bhyg_13568 [Pseudolycoriella hygida]